MIKKNNKYYNIIKILKRNIQLKTNKSIKIIYKDSIHNISKINKII